MNIWCISKYASLPKYGTGARLFFLAKEFQFLGHSTTLITSDSNHLANYPDTKDIYNFEKQDNVSILWIKTRKYIKTASLARILSWFDFEKKLFQLDRKKLDKPDVVIVSSLSLLTIIHGYYLKRKYESFLVFEIRDIWPLTMTEEGGFSRWHPLVLFLGWIEKFGYKNSDLIVGTMPKLDLHIKNILGYKKSFFCSPLGFEPNNYKNDFSAVNLFDNLFPKDKIIIGYAGSMGITNALVPFINSIKLLKNNDTIHFMLVGSGALKNNFEDELREYTNVTFLGRIEQNKVKYFLNKCDILYLSTQHSIVWNYGQSMNKVVEYMLASKPIIASYSGYPSMINEAQCGYFIDSEDPKDIQKAILDIVNLSQKKRDSMGERGRKWIYKNRQYSKLAKDYLYAINRINDNA